MESVVTRFAAVPRVSIEVHEKHPMSFPNRSSQLVVLAIVCVSFSMVMTARAAQPSYPQPAFGFPAANRLPYPHPYSAHLPPFPANLPGGPTSPWPHPPGPLTMAPLPYGITRLPPVAAALPAFAAEPSGFQGTWTAAYGGAPRALDASLPGPRVAPQWYGNGSGSQPPWYAPPSVAGRWPMRPATTPTWLDANYANGESPFRLGSFLQTDSSAEETSAAEGGQRPIGERPPEEINRLLVRDTSLLLGKGNYQIELSTLYLRQELPGITVLPTGAPALQRLRSRILFAPFSMRYGLTEKTEVFAVVPFGISQVEVDDVLRQLMDETAGIGDVSFGFVRELGDKWEKLPDATFSFTATAPTGPNQFNTLSGNSATLGNGIWRLGVTLNFVESYDPIVAYWGLGYQYQFLDVVQGLEIQRGQIYNYYFGLGFAVSDDVSLSAQLSGSYQETTRVNGNTILNSDTEPISLRFGYVRRLSLKSRIQPFVDFGLTRDAADTSFGIRFIHQN